MFQKGMVRGEARDGESGEAIAKAAFEDETAHERRGSSESYLERGGAPSCLEHLSCSEGSVSLADHAVVVRSVAHTEVEHVASENLDAAARVHLDRFVNMRALPTPPRAAIQSELIIRIPAAAANPTTHVLGASRDSIAVGQMFLIHFAKRGEARKQFVGDALIRIEAENPFVLRGFSSELLLCCEARPITLDDTSPAVARDPLRAVG